MWFVSSYPYFLLFLTAFLVNIPCGYIRAGHPKFSGPWFFWVHASIPVLIFMRLSMHTSAWMIPLTIFYAVLGQIMGSRWRQTKMGLAEHEAIEQISDRGINLRSASCVKDTELTVALLNMGGPRTNDDVKDFQQRLFEDPLLIRFPLSALLQKFFAWILIRFRLKLVKATYQRMGGGSPIYRSTTAQTAALRNELQARGHDVDVTYSFNYSPPFPEDTILRAKRHAKKYFLPLSLYPHYSKATTGSNIFYLKKKAGKHYPALQFLKPQAYYLHEGYIEALIDRIYEALGSEEQLEDFYLLFSAHGLPLYFLKEGDPYPFQIAQTVGHIVGALKRYADWSISYQSAVGPLQWLKPSTEETIKALARRGVKKMIVVPVSFVGDHIETICEVNDEYRKLAETFGISDYRMSKAIECHPGFIRALADSVVAVLNKPAQLLTENNSRPSAAAHTK